MADSETGKGLFSVSEFAKYSRTTKDTLLHYDRIGLISAESRGSNKYRYYSGRQLAAVNVIRTFQELGMSLTEIKELIIHRKPEDTYETLNRQIETIDTKIGKWVSARKLLLTLQDAYRSVQNVNEQVVNVRSLPREAIILGGLNDYSNGRTDYDALQSFYRSMSRKYPKLNYNYPVWGTFSERRIKQGDWVWPDRYYFYNPEGYDTRPAGLYAIGYSSAGYGLSDELYRRIIQYIDKNGYEICGDAYEEYPINEIYQSDDKKYLMRVMITVREKPHTQLT